MIPRSTIDQIIETSNSNIVDVVGSYVDLKRRGANYIGCCPFHNEKTPSFSVSPAKGFCYCFGCHKGGNAVNFIMEMEKIEFPDAIRMLGQRFGIEVREVQETAEQSAESREREALFAVTEYAARQFETNMRSTEEGQALGLSYFRGRGFRDDVIATFRLGYSLEARDAFLSHAIRDGYKEDLLLKAGLISVNDSGFKADKFRGRVIFPIMNPTGKVIAFGARVLDSRTKGVQLKYLNSPETPLYNKSQIVYGIFQARNEMSRQDKCFLVEGYTDVISMHQAGIKNVVASSGTALTVEQIRLIKRFTKNITVLYDGDSAGVHASLRGIDMILAEDMNVRVLLLPNGQDPDEFARSHSEDQFAEYVKSHETDFISFQAENLMRDAGGDPIKTSQTVHTIVDSIAMVSDGIMREVYVKQCSKIMQVSEQVILNALQQRLTKNAIAQRDRDVARQRQQEAQQREAFQAQLNAQQNAGAIPPPDDPYASLSPEEMEALANGVPMTQLPTPPAQNAAPVVRPDLEMREVVRFLVTYPQHEVTKTLSTGEWVGPLAQYVLLSLDNDSIVTQDPVLARIIDIFRSAPDITTVTTQSLMNTPDVEVAQLVAEMVGGRPELSHIHSKYTVIETEESMVNDLVERALNELRLRHLMEMCDDLMRTIERQEKEGAPEEEIFKNLQTFAQLNKVKTQFAAEMGERAVIR